MRFQVSFKHMDVSQALQEFSEKKIRPQIERFVTKPVDVHVTFAIDRHLHIVTCSLQGGDGFSANVEHASEDMYASVERVAEKLQNQLKKIKDRLKDHNYQGKQRDQVRSFSGRSHSTDQFEPNEVDAEDIIKYERARRRTGN